VRQFFVVQPTHRSGRLAQGVAKAGGVPVHSLKQFVLGHACPIHRGDGRGRTFSVNLSENVFCCFEARCGKQGDVIDLWAAVKQLSLREAALDLVRTFQLEAAPAKATEKRNG
jgi:hypothetical protein